MTMATEMTIALGRTCYGAPGEAADHDETIEGCETRVSVTWQLTESEQNLPLTASWLTTKAVQALEAVEQNLRRKPSLVRFRPSLEGCKHPPEGCKHPVEARIEQMPGQHLHPELAVEHEPTKDREDGKYQEAAERKAPVNYPGDIRQRKTGITRTDQTPDSKVRHRARSSAGTAAASENGRKAAAPGKGSESRTSVSASSITQAQRLAIHSLCTRHGVADWELRRLIWERFGKKEQGELSKPQAGELLNAIQEGLVKEGATSPAYA